MKKQTKSQEKPFSNKKVHYYNQDNFFQSPVPKNILEQQINELQLLNQQQLVAKLKVKKQQILKQSQETTQNCHQYFMDLTSVLIQTENKIKKIIDKQTLNFLQELQQKIQEVRQNQHSYNCNSEIYQILKMLVKNFTQIQENPSQISKIIQKAYSANLQGLSDQMSEVGMSTNKIYISNSQFITTNKKLHGTVLQISQREFELALTKYQQREQKNMLLNERLKTKIKSLEQMLGKKGVSIKEFNRLTTIQNQKCSQDYWDLELQRIKAENTILTEQINNISNKLIELTSQNQALKGQYKKMLQSNISQVSNQNNTICQGYEAINSLQQNSRLIASNNITNGVNNLQSQNFITSQIFISNPKQAKQQMEFSSGICLQSNLHNSIQNQMLLDYQKKVEQLQLQLTKKLTQMQGLHRETSQSAKELQLLKQQFHKKQLELQNLNHHYSTLQHDYEVSSKKRFQLQQKNNLLKQSNNQFQQKQKASTFQYQLQVENLQSMLKIKEQNIQNISSSLEQKLKSQYQQSLLQIKNQKQKLEKQMAICRKLLKQNQSSYELKIQNFKTQFKRFQKSISSKDQELTNLREQIYRINKDFQQLNSTKKDESNQTWKQKFQTNKKQVNKLKKQIKQKSKDLQNLKSQNIKMNELLGIKCSQINKKVQFFVTDLQKSKQSYEAKSKIFEEKQKLMKERFQHNLNQFVLNTQGQGKKNNFAQTIQKYIESMINFCSKTAEIKKLKQQIKELKTNKIIIKPKKQLSNDIDGYTKSLDQNIEGLSQIQRKIMEDRLKIQKGILQQKISILEAQSQLIKQKLVFKENSLKQMQQQFKNFKKQVKKAEISTKRQNYEEQLVSQNKTLEMRLSKLESQLKSSKNLLKKNQEQLSSTQNELKKKKQHIINIKKQFSSQQEKIEQLNFMMKNKSEDIEKLKRQLKDLSTKQVFVNQMKQKVEQYNKLQITNQQLKRQIQKMLSLHKFEISKLQAEVKELKSDKKQEVHQKITSKTSELNQQLNEFKMKFKKIKTQLERKQTFSQHTKTKYENQLNQLQIQLNQNMKQLENRSKQCQNNDKKIDALSINQRKLKDKCKLLAMVVKKVYEKLLTQKNKPQNKQNTGSLLQNTSPITRIFNSNVFANTISPAVIKEKENQTLQTLAQLDINLEDLDKYSEGLQMFGVNPSELKSIQNGFIDNHNQTSTFSHFMGSPDCKAQTRKNGIYQHHSNSKSPSREYKPLPIDFKQKIQKLSEHLTQKQQFDIGYILNFFEEAIQN